MIGLTKADIWNPLEEKDGHNKISAEKEKGVSYWLVDRLKDAGAIENFGAEMAKFGPFADMMLAIRAAKKRISRTRNAVEVVVQYGTGKRSLL